MMKIDFERDLADELYNGFDNFNIKLPHREKLNEHLLDYLSISKKLIFPKPRKVFYNPEFKKRLVTHPKAAVIKHLAHRFTVGQDVNSFQNKRLFQSKFHDHLVYEWNIFHFHLSLEQEKKSYFKKQVKQLLFALVTDKEVIFLDDDSHLKGTFGDVKWLEILHDHFPEVIAQYRDTKIVNAYPELNAVERQGAWDAGLLLGFTQVRGAVYHSPGIGRATSGHSILVSGQVNEIMRWLYKLKEQFTQYYDQICYLISVDPAVAEFKLRFGPKTFEIAEMTTNNTILTCYQLVDENLFSV
ncbi:MAG: hypothetical protein ACXVAY_12820 [Mucilaginibacter sp.]